MPVLLDEASRAKIEPYVSSLTEDVFALTGLPEEVIAVLFAYYSRSRDDLRTNLARLLADQELDVAGATGVRPALRLATEKARQFHEKWVVGYGHASVAEHAAIHLAVENVSFTVKPGEIVCLVGESGSGKSVIAFTVMGLLAKALKPTSGEILLQGRRVDFATPSEARASGIETIYQDLALADNLSVGANIFLGREPKKKVLGFLPVLDRKRMAEAARETMARLDFHVERFRAPVSTFSGGQRQAVAIGRAIYWNAQILIMDEPTAALGPAETRSVEEVIAGLRNTHTSASWASDWPRAFARASSLRRRTSLSSVTCSGFRKRGSRAARASAGMPLR